MNSTRGPLPYLYTAESSMSGWKSGFFDSSRTPISPGLYTACSMSQPTARARVACKLCNARRVRCDRSEPGAPCSNCRLTNTDCELIVSRRGKYGLCRFTTRCSREINELRNPGIGDRRMGDSRQMRLPLVPQPLATTAAAHRQQHRPRRRPVTRLLH